MTAVAPKPTRVPGSAGPIPRAADPTLEAAIVRAVAYADIFDFALTPGELMRYLVGSRATTREVETALAASARLGGRISSTDGFVMLHGRVELAAMRAGRRAEADRVLPRALRYARAVGSLPFVRMVAISGALAAGNAVPDADIDLFVVTESGRLWLARAASIAVVRFVARAGDELCPNYLLAETALELDERDLYAANELAHLVPVVGRPVYDRLREANPWVRDLLPNADGAPTADPDARRLIPRAVGLAEAGLRTPLGDLAEAWEQRRKVARFRAQASEAGPDGDSEAHFAADRCKGHFESHRRRIRAAYEQRVRACGVEPLWEVAR